MARGPGGGLFFNFNGTAGILRAQMIEDAGGWQHDTLTEDSDLSYRAQLKGWRFVYVPEVECPSELPVEMLRLPGAAVALGEGPDAGCACKLLPTILRAEISVAHEAGSVLHLTPNISYPLMMVISALMLPVMIVRFYMGWLQMVTDRSAADHRVVLVDLGVLPHGAARAVSEGIGSARWCCCRR